MNRALRDGRDQYVTRNSVIMSPNQLSVQVNTTQVRTANDNNSLQQYTLQYELSHTNATQFWCTIPTEYESLRQNVLGDPIFGRSISFCLKHLESINNHTVVDMGCGDGRVSVFLALHGAKVIGIDKRLNALKRASELSRQWKVHDSCTFLQSYSERMPIRSNTADVVISISTLQYMHKDLALNECVRILKPGGALLLNENLASNPIMLFYRMQRKLFAKSPESLAYIKSIQEYITLEDINRLRKKLSMLSHQEFHLFRMLSLGLRWRYKDAVWTKHFDNTIAKLDDYILAHVPLSKKIAWIVSVAGQKETTC